MAFATAGRQYARHYRRPWLEPGPGYEASPAHIRQLAEASAAPAQEALAVAFAGAQSRMGDGGGTAVPVTLKPTRPVTG